MKPILIEELIKATNGIINNNIDTDNMHINGISTDTRNIKQGDLFIPIVGENFDGHNFIEMAFEKGAIACLSQQYIKSNNIIINVKNTIDALGEFAFYYKNLFDIKTIGITGSTGKTSVKDMLSLCLSTKYKTVKTKGNFNNEIGLPLTIFDLKEDTEILVLEMGMNNFGEIRKLSKISQPDIAIITNIGVAHIENLGTREGIFRAKYEIFDHLKPNGIKILNDDDDILTTLKDVHIIRKDKYFYSIDKETDAFATNIIENGIDNVCATINYLGKSFDVIINHAGKHVISNSLAVTLICHILGLTSDEIKLGLEEYKPAKMRFEIIKSTKYTVINDTYNANPSSMKSSIDILSNVSGRKVAILGDMLELGEYSERLHYEIGEYAVQKNIDELILVGQYAYNMLQGAKQGSAKYFSTQTELLKEIDKLIKEGDTILVKASRGMMLENTVDKITR